MSHPLPTKLGPLITGKTLDASATTEPALPRPGSAVGDPAQPAAGPLVSRVLRPLGAVVQTARRMWALADQALISGSNFATMVLVARGLNPTSAAFGDFTLVYSGLLFANIFQQALITQPHNVLGTALEGAEYAQYTTATGIAQMGLAGAEALIALALALTACLRGWETAPLLLALAPSIVAWQVQEYVRRVLYTEGRIGAAFANDVISYGGQTIVVAVLWQTGRLTGTSAMYALLLTSLAAIVLGIWQLRGSLSLNVRWAGIGENWRFGKWLACAELVSWCSSLSMYLYLAAYLIGKPATGELKAAQILFGPARVIAYFLLTVLPIRFARNLARGGAPELHRNLIKVLVTASPFLVGYCVAVAVFAGPLLRLTYGRQYSGDPRVLALYSVSALIAYFQMIVAAALTAKRLTHIVFMGTLYGMAVAMLVSWPLIHFLQIKGVLIAMMFTTSVVTVHYVLAYYRDLKRSRLTAEATAAPLAALLAAEAQP